MSRNDMNWKDKETYGLVERFAHQHHLQYNPLSSHGSLRCRPCVVAVPSNTLHLPDVSRGFPIP